MTVANPAAFGRLRVETGLQRLYLHGAAEQPPSGDCVLKPVAEGADVEVQAQPSSVNLYVETRRCFPYLNRL